jgi:glutamyl-Q tRNA(Asp) synthetase
VDESTGTPRRARRSKAPFGDVVLGRKETPVSYHLACCHDDALQGVTHVIRGEDIREMTSVHALLQALMDWPQPVYRFHPSFWGRTERNCRNGLATGDCAPGGMKARRRTTFAG